MADVAALLASLAYWEMSSGRNYVYVQESYLKSLAYWEMSSGRNQMDDNCSQIIV